MLQNVVPLNAKKHLGHGWKLQNLFHFAAQAGRAPLLIAELAAALPAYPLAFMRVHDTYLLVALLGLYSDENLFVDPAGRWLPVYIPSCFRSYPFVLQDIQAEGKAAGVLCFDHASGLYREQPDPARKEQRFFNDDGTLQPHVQKLVQFLTQTVANRQLTSCAVAALHAAELLKPWALPVANPCPERQLQQGLFSIDEAALRKVNGTTLESLRDTSALAIAYAQLFSMRRLESLRSMQARRVQQPTSRPLDSLDDLFGEGDDAIIRF
jgi:hypothetical protein